MCIVPVNAFNFNGFAVNTQDAADDIYPSEADPYNLCLPVYTDNQFIEFWRLGCPRFDTREGMA